MKYIIDKINEDGSVDVSCSIDNKTQNISGLSIDDVVELDKELTLYTIAYEAGLAVEREGNQIGTDVNKLVGVEREVGTPLGTQIDLTESNVS